MLGLGNSLVRAYYNSFSSTQSLELDGSNDHLNIGDNLDFGTGDFSISMFIKPKNLDSTSQFLFSKYANDNYRIDLLISNANKLQCVIVGNGNTIANITGATSIATFEDSWVHVVLTCDRDGDTKIYLNGVTTTYGVSGTSANSGQGINNTAEATIGMQATAEANHFEGIVDEVGIWHGVALSSAEVLALYNSGDPTELTAPKGDYSSQSSLVAWYRMGDGLFDFVNPSGFVSNELGLVANQVGISLGSEKSVDFNTTNWEIGTDNFNGQTPIGDGIITVDGTQTSFSTVRPKSGVWDKTVSGEVYIVEITYTRSAGTVQVKATGDETTLSGLSFNASGTNVKAKGAIRASNTDWSLTFSSAFVGNVTSLSLKKVAPNHNAIVVGGPSSFSDEFSDSFN